MTLGVTAQPAGARGVDVAELRRRVGIAGVPRRFEEQPAPTSHRDAPLTEAELFAAYSVGLAVLGRHLEGGR